MLYYQLPALLITGYAGLDLEHRIPNDTAVLVKPYDMHILIPSISNCLNGNP